MSVSTLLSPPHEHRPPRADTGTRITTTGFEWPFLGRASELERFRRLVDEDRSGGLVIAGAAGLGKTRMALECLTVARAGGHPVARAAGHQASAELPFGALAHLLPSIDLTEARTSDRSGLMQQLGAALVGGATSDRRLVLFVDDAHLLDDLSATLLYQLAATGSAFVLLTLRSGESPPDPLVALWKDGFLHRTDLVAFPFETVEELVTIAVGGPVDRETIQTFYTHAGGNAQYLRELVLGAADDGSLRLDNGVWRLIGELHPSNRLVEIVESRLRGLLVEERELLELVSFAEVLSERELELFCRREVAERLEQRGLLHADIHRGRIEVRLPHPVYGDVLRAGLSTLRMQGMARALADAAETWQEGPRDVLRIGYWRLLGGGGRPGDMLEAAAAARWRYDFSLAERLVEAAQELGAGLEAELMAAKLSSIQGCSAQAESTLGTLWIQAVDDRQRSAITIARMDNFLYANRSEDSLAVAAEAESRIGERRWRDEITARRSAILTNTAGPRETLAAVRPLLDGRQGRPLVWACLTGARSLSRLGRFQESIDITARGLREHVALDEPLEWYPWFHLWNRCDALLAAGRLHEAEGLARAEYATGLAEHSPEAQAFFAGQLAKILLARGAVISAATVAREALGVFARIGRPSFVHEAQHTLASASAQSGDAAAAGAALAELDGNSHCGSIYDAADLLQARGWAAMAHGHMAQARRFWEDCARLGLRTGDLVVASSALHNLGRFWRAPTAERELERLTDLVDPGLITLRSRHIRHLRDQDPRRLMEVSGAFADSGANLLAADAAADAAVTWTRIGSPRAAAASARAAAALADECEGATSPALGSIRARATLTPAERETALLAVSGRSNKRIALELGLSVRSIENRLQHAYTKLGVSGRAELARALDLDRPCASR